MIISLFREKKSNNELAMLLTFTTIYCLLGLALISMGISLMSEQVLAKADWLASEIGMKVTLIFHPLQSPNATICNLVQYRDF